MSFHRVHDLAFGGNDFNTSTKGNARFSPITDSAGVLIPTLYAVTTLDCALMETIFHDAPFKAGFKPFSKLKMDGKVHSILLPSADLRLIDLSTVALHKLGVKRTQLIETTKAHYPTTRRWAEALYTQFLDAQGLRWTSRQDDQAHAIMLFDARINPSALGGVAYRRVCFRTDKRTFGHRPCGSHRRNARRLRCNETPSMPCQEQERDCVHCCSPRLQST